MNDRQTRRYERGVRAADFAESVKTSFPAGSKGADSIARIKELVKRVAALDASRDTSARTARAGTAGKVEAREALRALLSQISRTARAIALEDPALKERFRLYDGNPNAQALLATARSFLAEAAPLKERFVEYGMGADFLEVLGAKIADFEAHATRQHAGTSQRAADRAALDDALEALDEEVARFDAIARNKFAADPGLLAAWAAAGRVERTPRRRAGGESPPLDQPSAPASGTPT